MNENENEYNENEELEYEEKRKERQLRRKEERMRQKKKAAIRNRILFGIFLIALVTALVILVPKCINFLHEKMTPEMELPTITLPESTEAVTEKPEETTEVTTAEPTTAEPTTAAPDPRLDVLNHYTNVFVVTGTDTYLNVRDQPTQDGMIVGKMTKYSGGSLVENLGNGWFHINSGGIDGYIAGEYCTTGEEAIRLAMDHCYEMVQVNTDRLNVRSGPGEEYEVWTQVNGNERYVVQSEQGEWLGIAFNSSVGYINEEFTTKVYYLNEAMPWSSISKYSETRQNLIHYAEQFIGTPYVYGGTSLTGGIDCSSYTQQCYQNALGISIPRNSYTQVNYGTEVALADAKAGDLLFYAGEDNVIDHVVMYLGDGKIIHAALSLGQVIISKYNYSTEPVAVRNIIGD